MGRTNRPRPAGALSHDLFHLATVMPWCFLIQGGSRLFLVTLAPFASPGLLARAFVFAYWLNDIHIWILLNRRRSWLLIVLLSQSAVALIVTFAVMALLQVVNLILPPCVGWLICFVSFDCLEPNSRAIACLAAVQLLAINSSSFACLTVKK